MRRDVSSPGGDGWAAAVEGPANVQCGVGVGSDAALATEVAASAAGVGGESLPSASCDGDEEEAPVRLSDVVNLGDDVEVSVAEQGAEAESLVTSDGARAAKSIVDAALEVSAPEAAMPPVRVKERPVATGTAENTIVIDDSDDEASPMEKNRRLKPGEVAPKIESVVTTTVLGLSVETAVVPGVLRDPVIREFLEEGRVLVAECTCYAGMRRYVSVMFPSK